GTWVTQFETMPPLGREVWHVLEGVFRVGSTSVSGSSDSVIASSVGGGGSGVWGESQDGLQMAEAISSGSNGAAGGWFASSPADSRAHGGLDRGGGGSIAGEVQLRASQDSPLAGRAEAPGSVDPDGGDDFIATWMSAFGGVGSGGGGDP